MADIFNLEWNIPDNKIVRIYYKDGATPLVTQPLILDDEFSIKTSSKFGQLWEGSSNNFMSLLSNSFNLPSGQFALQGAQIWQSTDPINISIKCKVEMDTDPYSDVIVPTFVLMQTTLPKIRESVQENFEGTETKLIDLNLKLKTLIPPGPNLQTLINLMKKGNQTASKSKSLLASNENEGMNGVYNVKIGFCTFKNVIITSVEPTFSKTYATSIAKSNKKFPISADLSIEMTTMEVATTDMIKDLMNGF